MLINAFGLFFLAVLLGSSFFLFRCVAANRDMILKVLRGEPPRDLPHPAEIRPVRIEPCRALLLEPVAISICRI